MAEPAESLPRSLSHSAYSKAVHCPRRPARPAKGTAGLRLRVSHFDARAKLSQNKALEATERITRELATRDLDLVSEMRRITQDGDAATGETSFPCIRWWRYIREDPPRTLRSGGKPPLHLPRPPRLLGRLKTP